jgi:hypothetical protein
MVEWWIKRWNWEIKMLIWELNIKKDYLTKGRNSTGMKNDRERLKIIGIGLKMKKIRFKNGLKSMKHLKIEKMICWKDYKLVKV